MRFRQFAKSADVAAGNLREAQVMVRHPNNSGLQMDQLSRLYIPAYFVESVRAFRDEVLMAWFPDEPPGPEEPDR